MIALITGLSSTVIEQLHLTWAHVGRKSSFETLLKYNNPAGRFSFYRRLLATVEGSCVPFVGTFLNELVHVKDLYHDEQGLICFFQRQKWYEAISAMLRYQSRPYNIAESASTMTFISMHLRTGSTKDDNWFWTRSREVQQSELRHADIRKGLEAAGF